MTNQANDSPLWNQDPSWMDCAGLIKCLQRKFASLFEIHRLTLPSPTPKHSSDAEDDPEV